MAPGETECENLMRSDEKDNKIRFMKAEYCDRWAFKLLKFLGKREARSWKGVPQVRSRRKNSLDYK